MKYNKPHLSLNDQLARLQNRGMQIDDAEFALNCLAHVNYYRLRAYWHIFEQDRQVHQFKPGTTFADVWRLYLFDRELRLLLLDAIERVEVSLRTQWAYCLSARYGPFGYLDAQHSRQTSWLARNKQSLHEEMRRSNEQFIKHFAGKYTNELYPPIWMTCEIISFGLFSRWFKDLRPATVRADIARVYGLDKSILPGVVEHLVHVRNLCAHHSRVWNKSMVVTMPLPKSKPTALAASINLSQPRKLYNTLVILTYLAEIAAPQNGWRRRLVELLESYQVNVGAMGFPADWRDRPVWQRG